MPRFVHETETHHVPVNPEGEDSEKNTLAYSPDPEEGNHAAPQDVRLSRTNSSTSQGLEPPREIRAVIDEIQSQRNLENQPDDNLVLTEEDPYRCGCNGCMPVLEGYDRLRY